MKLIQRAWLALLLASAVVTGYAQNPLTIPPALSGTVFNLNIQQGTTVFFPGYNTPTYGINGVFLAPTLMLNKGDSVTLNVTNNLTTGTTIHWHGMHVPARWDGGPQQVITIGSTWSPRIKIMNDAGTYWYHPHGDNKTEQHVSKGLAGMIIVRDPAEAALTLPRTYGVDDFPVIVQTKAFDVLRQIAIATHDDTVLMVNGTLRPYLNVPAQVVRLRLLNGSSMRSFLFGLSGNMPFRLIGTDAGLLDSSVALTRMRLSPGERAEILVNLGGYQGQIIYLKNYGSELKTGIYGADTVGHGASVLPDYDMNALNGADFNVLQLNVVAPTASPVTAIPAALVSHTHLLPGAANRIRTISFDPQPPVDSGKLTEGPFTFNGMSFDMMTVNDTVRLNDVEIWRLINNTQIAHPFHIHDVSFEVLDINGKQPSVYEKGKKDVVLVMPGDTLRFITKFEDFADASVPYMYHCHLLHHEDDGMMGSFLVVPAPGGTPGISKNTPVSVYPNPTTGKLSISAADPGALANTIVTISDMLGRVVYRQKLENSKTIETANWGRGVFIVTVSDASVHFTQRLVVR
jgi:bilirubin oxidase